MGSPGGVYGALEVEFTMVVAAVVVLVDVGLPGTTGRKIVHIYIYIYLNTYMCKKLK